MAQAISVQVDVAHARRQVSVFLLHFGKAWSCSHAAQRLGLHIIRGPRPVTQKWPSAKANRQQPEQGLGRRASVPERPGRWRRESQCVGQPSQPRPRLSPEESRAGAATKVARLQAALLTLGPEDLVEKAALEASLQKTQVQATVPPLAEQVKWTTQFIERAKRRLSSASEWVQWAQDWHSPCSKELAKAEKRLPGLQEC